MDFNRNNKPSVTTNPFLNHVEPNVSTIMEDLGLKIKTKMDEVKASMEEIYKMMVEIRVDLTTVRFGPSVRTGTVVKKPNRIFGF